MLFVGIQQMMLALTILSSAICNLNSAFFPPNLGDSNLDHEFTVSFADL